MSTVLILGGGVSGLSAGIHCLKEGFDVTICEKHVIAGGNLTGWNRQGFHIDNCVHWLNGTNPNASVYKLWETLGVIKDPSTDVYNADVLYTSTENGESATLYRDLDRTEKELLEKYPADKREIKRFFKAVRTYQGIAHIRGDNHDKRNTFFELITGLPCMLRYFKMSIKHLRKHFKTPVLKEFVGDLFMSENFTVLAMIMTIGAFCADNAGLPVGGSLKMAETIEKTFKDLGGVILKNKEAVKINMEGKKAVSVTFRDGSEMSADFYIASMDTKVLFDKLLDVPMPKYLSKKYESKKSERFSSINVAFSLDMENVPFEENYFFTADEKYDFKIKNHRVMLREYGYCKDYAPKGMNVLQTMSFTNEEEAAMFISLREKDIKEYKLLKEEIGKTVLSLVEEEFPEFKGHLKVIDVWTPATYKRFSGSEVGSWMSFVLGPKVVPSMLQSVIPGVSNVLISSQWLQSPGGLPVAAGAGKSAAAALKDIYELEKKARENFEKASKKASAKFERSMNKATEKLEKAKEKALKKFDKH